MQYFKPDLFASFMNKGQKFFIQSQEDWQSLALIAINTFLVLAIVITLFYQGWQIFRTWQNYSVTTTHKQLTLNKPIEGIAKWHLLGVPPPPPVVATTAEKIHWQLSGVIVGRTKQENMAIIGSSPTDESVYKVGDKLSDGAVIEEISTSEVVLNTNGDKETLLISWESSGAAGNLTSGVAQPDYSSSEEPPPPPPNDKEP